MGLARQAQAQICCARQILHRNLLHYQQFHELVFVFRSLKRHKLYNPTSDIFFKCYNSTYLGKPLVYVHAIFS